MGPAEVHQVVGGNVAGKLHRQGNPDKVFSFSLTLYLGVMTDLHPLDKGPNIRKTGVRWAHKKS